MPNKIPYAALAAAYIRSLPKKTDGVSELSAVLDAFSAVPAVRSFVADTSMSANDREKALRIACPDLSNETVGFMLMLARYKMLKRLDRIVPAVERCYAEEGIVYARVESAVSLTDAQDIQLMDLLKKKTSADVRMSSQIHPELIGGLLIHIDDWTYDASIRGRLNKLKQKLEYRS
ncbi:MAG: ATP synthase F1 subunit delta [Patescibacteria group bacterium]